MSRDPVNTMPSTPGFSMISAPTVPPPPVTRLNAPSGTPASSISSASLKPVKGVSLAGLNTTVLPATIAPPAGPAANASGKLNGEITAHTP